MSRSEILNWHDVYLELIAAGCAAGFLNSFQQFLDQPLETITGLRLKIRQKEIARINELSLVNAKGWASILNSLGNMGKTEKDQLSQLSAEQFLPFPLEKTAKSDKITPKAARILSSLKKGGKLNPLFWRAVSEIAPDIRRLK